MLQITLHRKKLLFDVVLIHLGEHCTGKNLVQCCPRGSRQHCTWKNLFNVVVIFLGQHSTGKNPVQCCPRDSRQHCTGNPVHCRLNNIIFLRFLFWTGYFFDNSRLLRMPRQHWTNFPNIAQKNSGPTFNKKTRLYGTYHHIIHDSTSLIIYSHGQVRKRVRHFRSSLAIRQIRETQIHIQTQIQLNPVLTLATKHLLIIKKR